MVRKKDSEGFQMALNLNQIHSGTLQTVKGNKESTEDSGEETSVQSEFGEGRGWHSMWFTVF